jgi:hypothetical protein
MTSVSGKMQGRPTQPRPHAEQVDRGFTISAEQFHDNGQVAFFGGNMQGRPVISVLKGKERLDPISRLI